VAAVLRWHTTAIVYNSLSSRLQFTAVTSTIVGSFLDMMSNTTSLQNRAGYSILFFSHSFYVFMVIIDTVINTLLARLTLDPAGMHCPAWDDAFVFYFISLVLMSIQFTVHHPLMCAVAVLQSSFRNDSFLCQLNALDKFSPPANLYRTQ